MKVAQVWFEKRRFHAICAVLTAIKHSANCVSVAKCYSLSFRVVPIRAGGWCSTPGADRGGSRLHIHPTAKQFQIHVHLPSVTTKKPSSDLHLGNWNQSRLTCESLKCTQQSVPCWWAAASCCGWGPSCPCTAEKQGAVDWLWGAGPGEE